MEEQDPQLIAQLFPFGDNLGNARAVIDSHPSMRIEAKRQDCSQDSSEPRSPRFDGENGSSGVPNSERSVGEDGNGNSWDLDYSPCLRVGFDTKRKNGSSIVFGTCKDRCDIVIRGRDSLEGLAAVHCAIAFNADGQLILRDLQDAAGQRRGKNKSRFPRGTMVAYNGKGENKRRCGFTWILSGGEFPERNQPMIISLHQNLQFQIIVAKPNVYSPLYKDNVDLFRSGLVTSTDELVARQLGIGGWSATAGSRYVGLLTNTSTLSRDAILLPADDVGQGSFGKVHSVWNVSTGQYYARKRAHEKSHYRDLINEINILASLTHENVVDVFLEASRIEPEPLLIMEYVPLGSLAKQHSKRPLGVMETFAVLTQCLSALDYLHRLEPPVFHRDLKPSNILVQSRHPTLRIKIADFGFAKISQGYRRTFIGSFPYVAPEVFDRKLYDTGIDIWALGVIVLEYGYGLPTGLQPTGLDWTDAVFDMSQDAAEETRCPLINFVVERMLVPERRNRHSASRCLRAVRKLNPSEFRCSPPTWGSSGMHQPSLFQDSVQPARPGARLAPPTPQLPMSIPFCGPAGYQTLNPPPPP